MHLLDRFREYFFHCFRMNNLIGKLHFFIILSTFFLFYHTPFFYLTIHLNTISLTFFSIKEMYKKIFLNLITITNFDFVRRFIQFFPL